MQPPVFLTMIEIQMPGGALTSVPHRVTGVLLALGITACMYLLDLSVRSPQTYERLVNLSQRWPFKVVAIVFVWALAHHLLAGIRHLLSDVDIGSLLPASRRSAWIVNISGLAVAIATAGVVF